MTGCDRGRIVPEISAVTFGGHKDPGSSCAEKSSRLLLHTPLPPHFATAGTKPTMPAIISFKNSLNPGLY